MDVVRRLNCRENFDLSGQNIQVRTEQYLTNIVLEYFRLESTTG